LIRTIDTIVRSPHRLVNIEGVELITHLEPKYSGFLVVRGSEVLRHLGPSACKIHEVIGRPIF
ncbi:hypothetical protein GIB67_040103, partial [Kingdonia uniflora]